MLVTGRSPGADKAIGEGRGSGEGGEGGRSVLEEVGEEDWVGGEGHGDGWTDGWMDGGVGLVCG